MKLYVAAGRVAKGQLLVTNMAAMEAALRTWKDCDVNVVVEKVYATRSLAANAYYFGVVVAACAEASGYDPKEMHEVLKATHLPIDLAETGENGRLMNGLVVGGSTARLTTVQFLEYLERVIRWAAESLDCVIADPNPEWRLAAEAAAEVGDGNREKQVPGVPEDDVRASRTGLDGRRRPVLSSRRDARGGGRRRGGGDLRAQGRAREARHARAGCRVVR